MDPHSPPKRRAFRRAFEVPDIVEERHASEVIARRMLAASPESAPALDERHGDREPDPWTETVLKPALDHVQAFWAAYADQELDLALCGFGAVTGPGPLDAPMTEEAPAATARRAFGTRLTEGGPPVDAWFEWLWGHLQGFVQEHPFMEPEPPGV